LRAASPAFRAWIRDETPRGLKSAARYDEFTQFEYLPLEGSMSTRDTSMSPALSELPGDELIRYGRTLGLTLPEDTAHGEALRLVRARQELLLELDREAMLDVVAWLRVPVRRSSSKEQLAAIMADHPRSRFEGLTERGLRALARLSGVEPVDGETRENLEQRLRKAGGLGSRLRRWRRRWAGSIVSKILSAADPGSQKTYQFLPEEGGPSLRQDIEQSGLVGGVARRIKGAADEYVAQKLDEIEKRIDRKLDEIDKRLCEWRDREVTHRLRIIRITLAASVLVALLSLLYDYLRVHWAGAG